MKLPIFVARQFVRHRTVSINEVSARYVKLPNEFYIPKPEDVGHWPDSMKQGRVVDGSVTPGARIFIGFLEEVCKNIYEAYEGAISTGVPPEVARMMLPLNIYTKWVWKQDLHNLMHFLALRMDEHAQFESRQYAWAAYRILKPLLPVLMELFDKYRRL